MDDRQAFKIGFLRKCADAGLSIEETHEAVKEATTLVKTADIKDLLMKPYQAGIDVLADAGKTGVNFGMGAAALAPIVAGGGIGYGLSRLGDVDDTDVSAVKQQELIDEYHRQIELLNAKRRGVYKRPTPGMGA